MKPTVSELLKRLGIEKYAHIFEENAIDYDALIALTESDLQKLNIPIGVLAKLRKEIARINNEENTGNIE